MDIPSPPSWSAVSLMDEWFPARRRSVGPCDDLVYIANVRNFSLFPVYFPMSANWLWGRVTQFLER